MKTHQKIVTATSFCSVILLAGLLLVSGCKKNDPEPEIARIARLLKSSTWRIQAVTVDGTDKTSLFTGLTLTVAETNYTTTNGGLVWPASGTWRFADETGTTIERSDGLVVTVDDITDTVLKLSLTRATGSLGSGRAESIAGKHVFTFVK